MFFMTIFTVYKAVFGVTKPGVLKGTAARVFGKLMDGISNKSKVGFNGVKRVLLAILYLCIVDTVYDFIRKCLVAKISRGAACHLEERVSRGVGHVPVDCFSAGPMNRILSHIAGSISALKRDLGRDTARVVASIAALVNMFVVVLSVDPLVAIVTILVLPLSTKLVKFMVGRSRGCFMKRRACLKGIGKRMRRVCNNRGVVGTFGGRRRMVRMFGRAGSGLCSST